MKMSFLVQSKNIVMKIVPSEAYMPRE